MAPTVELRQKALDRLLPYQRSDFEGIFRAMDGMWKISVFIYSLLLELNDAQIDVSRRISVLDTFV